MAERLRRATGGEGAAGRAARRRIAPNEAAGGGGRGGKRPCMLVVSMSRRIEVACADNEDISNQGGGWKT